MTSSVIPARLQFQCGHAALVTLPRVKGETTAQRNERVAFEKGAALARLCDFCTPALELVVAAVEEPVLVAEVAPIELVLAADAEADGVPELVEVAEPAVSVAEVELAPVTNGAAITVIEVAPVTADTVTEVVHAPAANGTAKPRTPRRRSVVTPGAIKRGYIVDYCLERLVNAVDIRDALRKASAFGASEVLSITREN
jgi:hypothetical protein